LKPNNFCFKHFSLKCVVFGKIKVDFLSETPCIYKCLSRRFSLVIRSLQQLEIISSLSSSHKRVQLIKNIPTFKAYVLQKHVLDPMHRSVVPPLYSYSCHASIPLPDSYSFNYLIPRTESSDGRGPQIFPSYRRRNFHIY